LNVERALAQHRIQRAALYPNVAASAGGSVQHQPIAFLEGSDAMTIEQYSVGIGVSNYELDLFGRIRSLTGAALEQYLATAAAQRAATITLVSKTASVYLTLAGDQAQLRLARETLENRQQLLTLVTRSFELGVASQLDVSQARTSVETARADVARLSSLVSQDANALALLVGGPVSADLLPGDDLTALDSVGDVEAGVPSELLQRRPDIVAAEHQLRGANANIGAARARYFPTVSLTGSGGIGSTALGSLFSGPVGVWSFVPQVTAPIFNAGAIKAGVAVATVDRDIAVAQYERSIQSAFREVSDALAVRATIGDELSARQALVDATARSQQLSEARFKAGIDDYLAVLDAQRSLYGAQQSLIATRVARSLNLVALYTVLGGGWQEASVEPSAPPTQP